MLIHRLLLAFLCLAIPVAMKATDTSITPIPLRFEQNQGQAPTYVSFLARTGRGIVFLTKDGISLGDGSAAGDLVHLQLLQVTNRAPIGELPTGGFANYYKSKREDWTEHVPIFGRVRYANAYKGIDVTFHGNEQRLEFDFEIAPGASVSDIRFGLEGIGKISIATDGGLDISAGTQSWRLLSPFAYQIRDGQKKKVETSYRLFPSNKVGLQVGQFDHSSKLIIDPVVEYSLIRTYGSGVNAMQLDADGNLIIAGQGFSTSYPIQNGQPPNPSGSAQVFLTKLNGATKEVMYSTYLPASSFSTLTAMTLDAEGSVYLAGITTSTDFPLTSSNLGACSTFCNAGFVAKFASDGSLEYSTLLASGQVLPRSMVVDGNGNAYVTGNAADNSLQTTANAYQPTYQGQQCTSCGNAFFAKLNPSGTGYVFASYFGGFGTIAAEPIIASGIGLDAQGNLYIGGAGIPGQTVQPWQFAQGAFFLAKFVPDGHTLLFSTAFGSATRELPKMKVGADGAVYFVGTIQSHDFPYTINAAFHPIEPNDSSQFSDSIFATAIAPSLKTLKYSTYLGDGHVSDFTLDSRNHVYLAGTRQVSIPLKNPIVSGTPNAGFFLELDSAGNLVTDSQFGGHQTQQIPSAIAVDTAHSLYLVGDVGGGSPPFGPDPVLVGPLCDGVPAPKIADWCSFGNPGLFIAKIAPGGSPTLSVTSSGPPQSGLQPPFLFLRNVGSEDLHIASIALSNGLTQKFDTCGSTIQAGGSCILSVTDSNGRLAGGTVIITSDAQPSVQSFNVVPPISTPNLKIGDWPVFEDVNFIFPPQLVGTTTQTIPLRIWNLGTENSSVDNVTGVGDVLQTNDCGILSPGAVCTVQVSVTPSTDNAINQLGIAYDTNINTASHSGTGGLFQSYFVGALKAPQALLLSVPSLSFAHQLVGGTAIPRAVTVTNTTNAVISAPALSIQGASEFVLDGNGCTGPLSAHSSCAVAVKYVPTGNGNRSGTLMVSGQGASVHADLFAVGEIDSAVHVSPLELDFFSWVVERPLGLTLQLTNSSNTATSITNVATSPSDFTQTNDCAGQIPSGGSCSVQVAFTPHQLGARNGNITFNFSGGVVQQVVPLTGIGVTPLEPSVSTLNFGSVMVGQSSASQGVSLGNGRPIGAQAYTLNVSGDFAISENVCPNPMPAFFGCAIQISFSPKQQGTRQGVLTIGYPGISEQSIIPLNGIGLAPLIQVSSSDDAGEQLVGSSIEHTIAISNTGNLDLTISSFAVAGANASDFQIDTGQCGTIAPSSNCDLRVKFVPSAAGARSATLTINDNAANNPHSVTLFGTGTSVPFEFKGAPGSSTATVTAGSTAIYQLSLNRTPGFSGTVQLACGGVPLRATCSLQPEALDLSTSSSANFTVRISTTGAHASLSYGTLNFLYGGFVGIPLLVGIRLRTLRVTLVVAVFAMFCLIGCGGGSTGTNPPPSSPPVSSATPAGTYTVIVTGTSGTQSQTATLALVVQ
jgi:hypothetical protein